MAFVVKTMRQLRDVAVSAGYSVVGEGVWRPLSLVVCLISLIDIARHSVRAFVCDIT